MKKMKLFNLYGSTGQIGSKSIKIADSLSLDLKSNVNNVKNIIDFQNDFVDMLKSKFL